jgi:hypothetical protein
MAPESSTGCCGIIGWSDIVNLYSYAEHKVKTGFGLVTAIEGAQDRARNVAQQQDETLNDKIPQEIREVNSKINDLKAINKMAGGMTELAGTTLGAASFAFGGVEGTFGGVVKSGVTNVASKNLPLKNSVSEVMGETYTTVANVSTPITNKGLVSELRATSYGDWSKVYEAGIQNGAKVEVHYFQNSTTKQVFDVKEKYTKWHQIAFKNLQ